MCHPPIEHDPDSRGVSWGEVLELVSGRRELPQWPPFNIAPAAPGLGISTHEHIPMQKVDIDVPEEYREHYVRQSRKTKQAVDSWLARQSDDPSAAPNEVDDETLTFAILTHLDAESRPLYSALLGIVTTPLQPKAPTPPPRVRPHSLITSGLAIQRLYRLAREPRDPEIAIYMLNNPSVHNALATLAAISNDEWEILTSGRFDGFLRSGADDNGISYDNVNGNGSRTGTPYSRGPSRGPTPISRPGTGFSTTSSKSTSIPGGSHGAPVAMDEETEIAVLAEVEREIYLGMEALEDAFEALHLKAEGVRRALRDRNAGLTMASQARRGSGAGAIEARLGTPASMNGGGNAWGWDSETDDGIDDGLSEIAPDDSASNVSRSRRRRPKRRGERRGTPAQDFVAIEEEDDDEEAERRERDRAGRRRR